MWHAARRSAAMRQLDSWAARYQTVRLRTSSFAITALAFEFLVLTAARSGEVHFAAWDEMDTTEHVWTIPATRMKMKREHRVPLCGRALAILAVARALGDGPLVFPSRSGRRLDLKQLRLLLERCGIAAVPHGFRSSFRDWAGRGDGPSARGHRGGARPCRRQQGRGGLRPLGPVRAAATAHGQLGRLPPGGTRARCGMKAALLHHRPTGLHALVNLANAQALLGETALAQAAAPEAGEFSDAASRGHRSGQRAAPFIVRATPVPRVRGRPGTDPRMVRENGRGE